MLHWSSQLPMLLMTHSETILKMRPSLTFEPGWMFALLKQLTQEKTIRDSQQDMAACLNGCNIHRAICSQEPLPTKKPPKTNPICENNLVSSEYTFLCFYLLFLACLLCLDLSRLGCCLCRGTYSIPLQISAVAG